MQKSPNNYSHTFRARKIAMEARVRSGVLVIFVALVAAISALPASADDVEKVLTLDHSNFSDTVTKHDFIVVEFYAPCRTLVGSLAGLAACRGFREIPVRDAKLVLCMCGHCQALAPEIQGFPTIKILRNGGKSIQEYKGPREADGIASYLKRQAGPASTEIKSAEDAASLIDEKKIFIVGIFPKFSGEEFDNFTALAEKLRSDYDFGHALDAKLIPKGESVSKPTLRLLKPFDELFVDSEDFNLDALEKFIQDLSVPIVTTWNSDPSNHPYINKFFEGPNAKAMLFANFSEQYDAFLSKYKDVATLYKGKGINFLFGDIESTQNAFQYFNLKQEDAPLLIVQKSDGQKYLKTKIEPDQIAPWLKDYSEGQVKPYVKSEPIPEVNDEPVKVVVRDSLQDVVFNSGKNVLLEFYAPWCGHCQQLAPILDEVAISFKNDPDVVIAKFDATANDVPRDTFEVQGFPTMYFRSANGNLSQYDGGRTKDDIISFIEKNRDKPSAESTSAKPESEATEPVDVDSDSVKDELFCAPRENKLVDRVAD
ncbi:protein disulfide-isomerase [Striga asiatica]|uniref:protein disulfide-isomerase n=1 Tax=Striga asiatica TaxID=4170 RepID=A0A5A7PRH6_STRAF|nr:protein disulfide-isomerase [Striga asiatica]